MKQHLKCANEITKEDTNANVAISKSASTPASLQAVIRFQDGSNMSLQHKVSFKLKIVTNTQTQTDNMCKFVLGYKSEEKFKPVYNTWNIKIPFTSNSYQCTCFANYCWYVLN